MSSGIGDRRTHASTSPTSQAEIGISISLRGRAVWLLAPGKEANGQTGHVVVDTESVLFAEVKVLLFNVPCEREEIKLGS
jgi:hypothetical protein